MSIHPKVSVIMATFNCANTVRAAVDSIRGQTYENWELVICDDASTDRTAEILAGLADGSAGRIVLLRNSQNRKLAYSLNRCLTVATGELVARMDGDDISEPKRLQRQVEFLMSHPDCDLVGTGMLRFDASGPADVLAPARNPDRFTLRKSMPFFHATIMTYKRVFDAVGNYTVLPRTERGQDYDLWFKFFHAGFAGDNIPEPLYRVREDASAIRRRTAKVRLRGYRTTLVGYRLLGFPLHWYFRPTIKLLKIVFPHQVVHKYRSFQKNRYLRRHAAAPATGADS